MQTLTQHMCFNHQLGSCLPTNSLCTHPEAVLLAFELIMLHKYFQFGDTYWLQLIGKVHQLGRKEWFPIRTEWFLDWLVVHQQMLKTPVECMKGKQIKVTCFHVLKES